MINAIRIKGLYVFKLMERNELIFRLPLKTLIVFVSFNYWWVSIQQLFFAIRV